MKSKITLKTLYRSPVRTVLTLILLVAVTFALFSQVLEHSVASREMDKAIGEYIGAGSVEIEPVSTIAYWPNYAYTDPRVPMEMWTESEAAVYKEVSVYKKLSDEQIDEITSLPYVTDADFRYMTAGVSDDYFRLPENDYIYDYARNCVIVGTITEISDKFGKHSQTNEDVPLYKSIIIENCEVLAGNPSLSDDLVIQILSRDKNVDYADSASVRIYAWDNENPEIHSSTIVTNTTFPGYTEKYGKEAIEALNVGDRYVFIVRYYAKEYKGDGNFYFFLGEPLLDTTPGIWHVEGENEDFLETEKFAELKEYVDMVNTDIYTFDVVYTADMESIRFFADGTLGIVEGRTLRPSDSNREICVVSHEVATAYGLKVGDNISLKLGDKLFEQYVGLGAVAAVPERLSESYMEVDLEIVGIYKDVRSEGLGNQDPHWSYSHNAIFVPSTLLNVPESELENHEFAPGEFSFIIGNTWDIEAFKMYIAPQFEEMGLTLFFNEGNWLEIVETFESTQRISEIKIAVLLAAVFVATCFVAFLYIVGRKRDYAIMRLLGTSKGKAGWSLMLPLVLVAVVAAVLGCVLAINGTMQNLAANETLAQITEIEVNTDIPALAIVGCFAGEIILVLLVSYVMLSIIGARPPLLLVQTGAQRRASKKKIKKNAAYVPEPKQVVLGQWVSIEPVKRDGKKRNASFVVNYVKRQIKRSKSKALMFVLVTVLLLNVAGQMLIMRESYERLLTETKIVSNFADNMNLSYVFRLKESGYVKDVYYYSMGRLEAEGDYAVTYITTDMERSVEIPFEITWAEGYDETAMQKTDTGIMVVGQILMEERGWSLGQTVRISTVGTYGDIRDGVYAEYEEEHGVPDYDNMTDAEKKAYAKEKAAACQEIIDERFAKKSDEFVIVGVSSAVTDITPMAEALDDAIFTPGLEVMNNGYGKLVIPMIIEATLADNTKAEEYRAYGEELAASTMSNTAFIMDTSKLDNLKNNITLMKSLIPIVTTAVMVIGAFLCGLIIVQTSKDIAIMRVLGTSKAKTRTILVLEQMVLCVIGVIIAGIILYIRGAIKQMLWVFGTYALVILLASIVASVAASRKNVLELLQTKE